MANRPASSERPESQPSPQDQSPDHTAWIELELSLFWAELALARIELGISGSHPTMPADRANVPGALVGIARAF
jgi:hypothetical protein